MESQDAEIKKALECCRRDDYEYCEVCPYLKNKPCQENLIRDCFDFINRQQAEIERLQNTIDDVLDRQPLLVERSEKYAIKDFAERLKEKQRTFIGDEYAYEFIPSIEIDVLLAEVVGEQNV